MTDMLTLGSDMTVRRMGFGAMRITGPGVWGPPADEANAIRVLRRAVALGINLIDTADAYGPNTSEALIKAALHPYPDDLVIATKGGLTRPGPNQWKSNGSPAHLRSALEGSLSRLGVERIDLYQLHVVADATPLEDSLGELKRLQEEGKIRHIGVCNQSVQELERSLAVVDIVSVQNRYNITDRKSDAVVDACERKGLGFLPWYPLAAAALVERKEFESVTARHQATASQICLAWLLRRSPVMLPIPGTSSVAHLEENTAARDLQLSDEDVASLEQAAARIG